LIKTARRVGLRVLLSVVGFVFAGVFLCNLSPVVLADDPEPTGLNNVILTIYPEYDDPKLLIMLHGELDGVEAPAVVRFLVPEGSLMYSAGWFNTSGQYEQGSWEGNAEGNPPPSEPSDYDGWDVVTFGVESNIVRVEYYYDGIEGSVDKTASVELISFYPVTGIEAVIQEPLESSNFSVTHSATPSSEDTVSRPDTVVDAEGNEFSTEFQENHYHYDSLDAETPLSFDISYTKSDPDTSLTIAARTSTNWALIIGLSVLGAVALIGAIYWVASSLRKQRPEKREPEKQIGQKAKKKKKQKVPERAPGQPRFCTKCGSKLEDSAKFCSDCGASVHK